MTDTLNDSYDALVVGGGAAGLNGAVMLARSRREVAVVDAGRPRNAPAAGVHGMLGHDGVPPGELLARGRAEARGFGAHLVDGEVDTVVREPEGFRVRLTDGRVTRASRLLITTGLVDELPAVPGLAERWGREVVHCPYCHGWEVRDRAIAVLASGPMSVHQALMFRQLSDDVVFLRGDAALSPEDAEKLAARDIAVIDSPVTGLQVFADRLIGVQLADGRVLPREVVAVATRMVARASFLTGLGLRPVPHPSGAGEHLSVDAFGRTEVAGVWAAGNVTDLTAQVGAAAAAGALAAAHINADLINAETERAVAARRAAA